MEFQYCYIVAFQYCYKWDRLYMSLMFLYHIAPTALLTAQVSFIPPTYNTTLLTQHEWNKVQLKDVSHLFF